ncbi:hypothetical protein AMATHDRAFT_11000 [Amanita thiersii Skay4041]|uniref:Uncharacterized protein n=1 Tax=Amanita thiersii Skay4041 TaxID=703135 RepID=A0A2A9NAJ6_9AGAR|nr:hypothetical protein AMATHDRAFT_11000 [Amanita thiersii Skay4041]
MVIDTPAKAVPEDTPALPANKSKKRSASSGPSNLSRPSTLSPSVSDTSTKVNNDSSPVSKCQKSSPDLAFGDSKDIMDVNSAYSGKILGDAQRVVMENALIAGASEPALR